REAFENIVGVAGREGGDPKDFSHNNTRTALSSAIADHYRGRDIRNALARHGLPVLNDKTVSKIKAFAEQLRNSPTAYFEAKPRRVVDLREFKAALVHRDGVERAKRILDKYKIPVIPYDNENHRR